MKKRSVFTCSKKYLPLYFIALSFAFICKYIDSLVSMFIGEALSIFANEERNVLPGFLAKFVNRNSTYDAIISVCVIFVTIAVINVFARLCQNFTRVYATRKIEVSVSSNFFDHALRLPRSYLVSHPTGDIIQRNIQDSSKYTNLLASGLWHFATSIFAVITIFIQIFTLSKMSFIVGVIIVGSLLTFGILYSFLYIRKKEKISSEYASKVDSLTQQSFSNIQMVKSFANEEMEKEKFHQMTKELEDIKYKVERSYANYWYVMDVSSVVYSFASMIIIGFLFFNGAIGLGAATSLIMLNGSIVDQSSQLSSQINHILRNSVSISRLNEYFKAEEDFVIDGDLTPEIDGDIEFKNVSMAYDDNPSEEILKNISFKIRKGETLGIVGKSGSGKSTIINLLTRLDEYNSGSITINNIELKDINKKHLRENMGIVNQESFVFAKTIKDNLTILSKSDNNLDNYIEKVCLKDDIKKMNEGIDTVVGERGVTLSGGQRQRISIARSLMKNKNVLILDDSLSALDNNVAKTIKNGLKENQCTTLIISHNLMNVMDADNIIVLDKGEIIQQGNHQKLVNEKGLYRDIFNLQQSLKEGDNDEE